MTNIEGEYWKRHHNISECFYHIQLTIKYRKPLFSKNTEEIVIETLTNLKDRYAIEISDIGFDKNHIHILCRFLPTYSAGSVIKIIKSISAKQIFQKIPQIKKDLWGGEFWTDGYYISTISGKGNKKVIENYIRNQGRAEDISQLRLISL